MPGQTCIKKVYGNNNMVRYAKFAYTTNYGKLGDILKKIIEGGSVPQKADAVWLGMNGAGKQADRTILSVFKFVGLTDLNDVPTAMWRALRGKTGQLWRRAYVQLIKSFMTSITTPRKKLMRISRHSSGKR